MLGQTDKLRQKLFNIITDVQAIKEHGQWTDHLKSIIKEGGKFELENFEPTPLPIDPTILTVGVVPESCNVFKSALSPLKLTFKVSDDCYSEN